MKLELRNGTLYLTYVGKTERLLLSRTDPSVIEVDKLSKAGKHIAEHLNKNKKALAKVESLVNDMRNSTINENVLLGIFHQFARAYSKLEKLASDEDECGGGCSFVLNMESGYRVLLAPLLGELMKLGQFLDVNSRYIAKLVALCLIRDLRTEDVEADEVDIKPEDILPSYDESKADAIESIIYNDYYD